MMGRIARALDLDGSLLWGLGGKALAATIAPITTLLVAWNFSPQAQGYYYTFSSLTALQSLVELGLTGVITTFASHEWAGLTRNANGSIEGDASALSRLASLMAFSGRWFGAAALVITALLLIVGFSFLNERTDDINWRGPWICLSIIVGINILFAPAWAILQGCGEIRGINFYRLIETSLRTAAVWVLLLLGGGLWTLVASAATASIWSLLYLSRRYRSFFVSLYQAEILEPIAWKRDILPLQWRTALMWPSGYLMFSLFTPALFHYQGAVIAGQMGTSWSLISGISGLAATWMQVRAPAFGALVARQNFSAMDRFARRAALIAFGVVLSCGAIVFAMLNITQRYAPWLRERFLPSLPIMIFLAAEAVHQLSFVQSSYLRSFKREPFLLLSMVCGWSVAVSTIVSAKYFGSTGIAVGYLLAIVLAIVWGTRIFIQCRAAWAGLEPGVMNGYLKRRSGTSI